MDRVRRYTCSFWAHFDRYFGVGRGRLALELVAWWVLYARRHNLAYHEAQS